MNSRLKSIETVYIDAQTLLSLFADYKKPRECIARMVKRGELIRLKNGFYLVADKIQEGPDRVVPYEQIANRLYGPSYVSLEWALSFYGMIPERVHTITSMTLGRDKEYHTSIGDFVYHRLTSNSYPLGVVQKKAVDTVGGFLMACPEKALVDLVFISCKGLTKEQLRQELVESKRIDESQLRKLNKPLLIAIAKTYRAKRVDYLVDLVGQI